MIADFLPHENPSREHCQLIDCTDISVIPDIQSSDSLPGKGEVRKLRLHCLMRAGILMRGASCSWRARKGFVVLCFRLACEQDGSSGWRAGGGERGRSREEECRNGSEVEGGKQ